MRRIRESVVEEIRISLHRDRIEAIQNVLERSREDIQLCLHTQISIRTVSWRNLAARLEYEVALILSYLA